MYHTTMTEFTDVTEKAAWHTRAVHGDGFGDYRNDAGTTSISPVSLFLLLG